MRVERSRAFTLVELVMVIAVIVIIATVGIPNLLSSRLTANETSAIATLKAITAAQAQAMTRDAVDYDGDGQGEFLYLAELSGTVDLRGMGQALDPAIVSVSLGNLDQSCATKAGYFFRIYLPDSNGEGVTEDAAGGKASAADVDPDLAENYWVAYAWPSNVGNSGRRAFVVNQQGTLLATANDTQQYSGDGTDVPEYDAAYSTAQDMTSKLSVNSSPGDATDGGVWVPVN